MGWFEQPHAHTGEIESPADIHSTQEAYAAARDTVAQAERRAAFQVARASELGALIARRQVVLERETALTAAIERARTALDLIQKIHAKVMVPSPQAAEIAQQMAKAEAKLAERHRDYDAVASERENLDGEIGRKDAELRSRFGLSDRD